LLAFEPTGACLRKITPFFRLVVMSIYILTVVNNLLDLIFGLFRAICMILLRFGIVQIGLSLKSLDPSQRAKKFLTLVGGVIITFAKELLNFITG
jgi:hypothetical protein